MKTFDFTADMSVARQGDVLIFRLPTDIKVDKNTEISPGADGKLILLEGEMTGHHHAINVLEPPTAFGSAAMEAMGNAEATHNMVVDALGGSSKALKKATRKTNKMVEDLMGKAANVTAPLVRMFSDKGVVEELVRRKIMTRTDLYVGTVCVEGGGDVGVVLGHQEHDGIRLSCGNYYVGRQIESAGAEERKVRD